MDYLCTLFLIFRYLFFLPVFLISLLGPNIWAFPFALYSQYATGAGAAADSESCCCGRAIYRATFKGFWRPQPVTRLEPDEAELRTGWRGLIGASHSGKFSLFQQDKMAPQHLLKELSQELVTATFLENHMKTNQEYIRTVIRMPDLHKGDSEASAQLAVTSVAHSISFFANMHPTTDWFVGLDSVSLCNRRCIWAADLDLDLGLFDAGTHEPTWEAPSVFQVISRQREVGAVVTLMSSSAWAAQNGMDDGKYGDWFRSPMAKLSLQRTAVLGNDTCRQNNKPYDNIQCAVTEWSDWSGCSCEQEACPTKYRYRQRRLVQPSCCDNLPPLTCIQAIGHTTERQECQFVTERN
ncbi:spondin-2-like [Convolutriloba macropyga]|uniref:spondin-2-like n=1 Tax=Convolutriloba macropyga TaxID=536237 RepID=UPI003F51DA37